jgi:hypothetical protein
MKDGDLISAGGMPVGFCNNCNLNQATLYFLDDKRYCSSCFPRMVDVKIAVKKLKMTKSEKGLSDECVTIQARFIGKNGSCGYYRNISYTLELQLMNDVNRFQIMLLEHGRGYCEYDSVIEFLKNWSEVVLL